MLRKDLDCVLSRIGTFYHKSLTFDPLGIFMQNTARFWTGTSTSSSVSSKE